MSASPYLLDKIARHGPAVERIREELSSAKGEFGSMSHNAAIAFDAADFVWAFFCVNGNDKLQETRELRNRLAEVMIDVLDMQIKSD